MFIFVMDELKRMVKLYIKLFVFIIILYIIEMRIDTKNKIIYLANPKTGSTSLQKVIDKYCDFNMIRIQQVNILFLNL